MRLFKSVILEVKSHKLTYLLLGLILIFSFIVRVYRVGDLLGFYYDQGRDALVIWRLWHEGKPFLIGPVTGLKGIFLGPFFYYLIAPLYLIGQGNPVYPAVFLSGLSVTALFILYLLAKEMHGRSAGLVAATIGGFSYYIFTHGRWLSNPNPILLSSTLLLYSMWKIIQGKNGRWWVLLFLTVGLSLQFEAASAVFYVPTAILFVIWRYVGDRKGFMEISNIKYLGISALIFLLTLLPQVVFNFRHDNLLLNNFVNLFFMEKAFKGISKFIIEERIKYFWMVYSNKLYAGWSVHALVFSSISLATLIVRRKKLKKDLLKLFIIFLFVPVVGYTLFQGNYGNIYDYYMSGYYLPLILLFSIGLAEFWKLKPGKIIIPLFLISFFQLNTMLIKNYLRTDIHGSTHISLGNQMEAVGWLLNDAKGGEFNVEVYVPPVIPYAYDYLFLWQATRMCGDNLCGLKKDTQAESLYTLYESDPPHPDRLGVWLDNQERIGMVEYEAKFGGITVQKRRRL